MYLRPGHSGPLTPSRASLICGMRCEWRPRRCAGLRPIFPISRSETISLQSHTSSSVEKLLLLQALIRPPTSNKPVTKDRGYGSGWPAWSHILPAEPRMKSPSLSDVVWEQEEGVTLSGQRGCCTQKRKKEMLDQTKPKMPTTLVKPQLPPVFCGFWRLWGRWIFEERQREWR